SSIGSEWPPRRQAPAKVDEKGEKGCRGHSGSAPAPGRGNRFPLLTLPPPPIKIIPAVEGAGRNLDRPSGTAAAPLSPRRLPRLYGWCRGPARCGAVCPVCASPERFPTPLSRTGPTFSITRMSTIQRYFSGKTVLVTGATGFLGKALLEKMLRSLPDVRRLYLLIRGRQRGTRPVSATALFRADLPKSSVSDRLKGQLGEGFDDHVDQRVAVIAGDLSDERLGVGDDDYRRLTEETQVIINSAAVVVFDERL